MFRPFLNQDMYKNIERIKFLIKKDSDISQIVIFGAGNIGKRYALMIEDDILLSKNHMVFCDNNEMLWGSIWQYGSGNEISIISPEQLKKEAAYSIVLVATTIPVLMMKFLNRFKKWAYLSRESYIIIHLNHP